LSEQASIEAKMGLSIRSFFVDDNDKISSVATAKINRLFNGDPNESFPEFSNSRIKLAEAVVELIDRKPYRIIKIEGSFLLFDSSGRLDKEELFKEIQIGVNSASQTGLPENGDNVIDASSIFSSKIYKNKCIWEPKEEIRQSILKAIFGYE
jgi:hypothetical protein